MGGCALDDGSTQMYVSEGIRPSVRHDAPLVALGDHKDRSSPQERAGVGCVTRACNHGHRAHTCAVVAQAAANIPPIRVAGKSHVGSQVPGGGARDPPFDPSPTPAVCVGAPAMSRTARGTAASTRRHGCVGTPRSAPDLRHVRSEGRCGQRATSGTPPRRPAPRA